jgi:outer membrane protein OmpA-like peptidoglycan-associated protein
MPAWHRIHRSLVAPDRPAEPTVFLISGPALKKTGGFGIKPFLFQPGANALPGPNIYISDMKVISGRKLRMKTKLVLSLALSAFTCMPLAAQQGAAPSTPDNQNPPSSPSQSTSDSNSAADGQKPDTQTNDNDQPNGKIPTYRVTVVQRTTEAVDYRDRGGTTQVDFKGTSLMPAVDGNAKVAGHTGRLAIDATLRHLAPPRSFGPEYLTYVLWAITPEGRALNMGEVRPNDDGNSRLQVTSGLQEFGMIVTAEPYFAVTRPSNLVVAENIVRPDTAGGNHPISAKFDLLEKGQYTVNLPPDQLPATTADRKTPLELLEAQNAIAIAQAAGAEQYAADTLGKAKAYLAQGQDYLRRKQGITPIGAVARAATQAAEDARLLTLQKKQEEQTAAERQRAQDRIQQAQSQAESESARADAARLDAQHQKDQRDLADQERQAAEQARLEAEQAAQQATQDKAAAQQQLQQSEQARQAALQQQQTLTQQAEQSRLQAQQSDAARDQAVRQAEEQRQRLLTQLNQVLQTRDSARGLIVSMSDVLFDFNRATLKPGAKLRLAKVSGIILAYPDLKLEIDGFTDNKGTPDYNMTLSEKRAKAVRDFLVAQGVGTDAVNTKGYGEASPVASNATAAGRQQNRRVELVVSGNAIGSNTGSGGASNGSTAGTGGVSGATQGNTTPARPGTAAPGSISSPAGTQPATTRPPNSATQPAATNPPATDNRPPQL